MIWLGLVLTASIAALEGPTLIRERKWRESIAVGLMLLLTLVLAGLVQFQIWLRIDPLGPIKAVFTPLTGWIFGWL